VRVGVVGLGLIGGSLLRGLGGAAPPAPPAAPHGPPSGGAIGFDRDPAVRAAAAAEGHAVAPELGGLAGCELIFVAVPPAAVVAAVTEALAVAPVVADTASVKAPVTAAIADERFVAAHPLAGAESAGWSASSPEVLRGAPWAVCSGSPRALCAVAEAVDLLDGHLVPCTAAEHDAAVARTSHVPHVVAQALAGTVEGDRLRTALTGGSYRDMTRVAAADPKLWGDILLANREAVLEALDALTAALATHRDALAAGDPAAAWRTPATPAPTHWEPASGTWDDLLGHRVRRLRLDGEALTYEVAR
jgi:prephenate dehydrogenase